MDNKAVFSRYASAYTRTATSNVNSSAIGVGENAAVELQAATMLGVLDGKSGRPPRRVSEMMAEVAEIAGGAPRR